MKIHLVNLENLTPASEEDWGLKSKLKRGKIYSFSVREARNYKFHQKYFALINCAWEFLNEKQQALFKTQESFRKTFELSAGHCERVYSIQRKEFIDIPKSISFEAMDEIEFNELYERVFQLILNYPLKKIDREYFEEHLKNF